MLSFMVEMALCSFWYSLFNDERFIFWVLIIEELWSHKWVVKYLKLFYTTIQNLQLYLKTLTAFLLLTNVMFHVIMQMDVKPNSIFSYQDFYVEAAAFRTFMHGRQLA
jgi:hypothetical protein